MPSAFYYPMDATNHRFLYATDPACKKETIEKEYKEAYEKQEEGTTVWYEGVSETATICWKTLDPTAYNQNNASYFLTYSMARVQNLTQADTGKSISKVAIGTLFTLIIQVVYLAAFLAMYLALIIRVAALWVLMAFSPFLVLMYYLTKDMNIQA